MYLYTLEDQLGLERGQVSRIADRSDTETATCYVIIVRSAIRTTPRGSSPSWSPSSSSSTSFAGGRNLVGELLHKLCMSCSVRDACPA